MYVNKLHWIQAPQGWRASWHSVNGLFCTGRRLETAATKLTKCEPLFSDQLCKSRVGDRSGITRTFVRLNLSTGVCVPRFDLGGDRRTEQHFLEPPAILFVVE